MNLSLYNHLILFYIKPLFRSQNNFMHQLMLNSDLNLTTNLLISIPIGKR